MLERGRETSQTLKGAARFFSIGVNKMTPHMRQFVSCESIELFLSIKETVERMPDLELGMDEDGKTITLSCHILARAIAKLFPVVVVDGYFASVYQHSWVNVSKELLIDAYPVGALGGPIAYSLERCSPAHLLFRATPTKQISNGRFGRISFQRSIQRVVRALRG